MTTPHYADETKPMADLKLVEMRFLDRALGMESGYVLDFTDRTMSEFFDSELRIDIDDARYKGNGGSKARRLRSFLQTEDGLLVARALRALWIYRDQQALLRRGGAEEEEGADEESLKTRYFEIVCRIEGDGGLAAIDAIDRFTRDETLDELVAAIERDVQANKPQVALDRLHTYCMKKFGHLLRQRDGETPDQSETLNSRAGRVFNPLRKAGKVRPISGKIMKTTVEVFELFNRVRNDESLAHDNDLVDPAEARYIFDSVVSLLRFLKAVETQHFGG